MPGDESRFMTSRATSAFNDQRSETREPRNVPTRSPTPTLRPLSPWKELIPTNGITVFPSCQSGGVAAAGTTAAGGGAGAGDTQASFTHLWPALHDAGPHGVAVCA